jgi:hypothetical protein
MDRTYLKCHVYDCPENQREAARAALEQWGTWGEYVHDPESPVDGMTTAMDVPCDTVPGIAAALRKAAPGASWVTWEEPTTGHPGRAAAFTPALGQHEGECGRSGETLIGRSGFEALRAHHSGEALLTALDTALGGPWARDYAARVPTGERMGDRLAGTETAMTQDTCMPCEIIHCGPCGAEIEEQDTGLWETGGDTVGQRRHCTESRDHLHHPEPGQPGDRVTFEVTWWVPAQFRTRLDAQDVAGKLRAVNWPEAAETAAKIARREITSGDATEDLEDDALGSLADAIRKNEELFEVGGTDGELADSDDAETYHVYVEPERRQP